METISFTINLAPEVKNFNQFEDYLVKEIRLQVCDLIARYLAVWDRKLGNLLRQRYPQYRFRGFIRRKVRCYFGTIWVKVRRYCHAGWRDVYPLLYVLPKDGLSIQLRDLILELVTDVSYQRTNRYLKLATGVDLSGRTIWRKVQRLGQEERNRREAVRHKIFEAGRDEFPQDYHQLTQRENRQPVYLEVDGTMVSSQERGEERFEIKTGIMYSQVQQIGQRRWRLSDKVLYGRVSKGLTFGEQFYAFCRERGLDLRRKLVLVSDGAGWIHSLAENVFPEAEKRLDLYHLRRAWETVLDEAEAADLTLAVVRESGARMIERIQEICRLKNLSGESVSNLIQYLINNRESIHYPPGERHGSGGVEKNIGILVGRRFKKQGMSWSHEGANNLLALRAKKLNQLLQQESEALNYDR